MALEHLIEELKFCALKAKKYPIEEYFRTEPERLGFFSKQFQSILFDFSKCQLGETALIGMWHWANFIGLEEKRAQMFGGDAINATENRAVLHVALRNPERAWFAKGDALGDSIKEEMARASAFADKIHKGEICANNGEKFKSIIHIGIGGSDLGPRLAYEALKPLNNDIEVRFCANIEPNEFANAINGLDPKTTLIIVVSKTFTTIETLTNFRLARAWLQNGIGENDIGHLVAITAAPERAKEQGFSNDKIFGFEEWVGGRFSMWSAVGLSLEMAFGSKIIADFHAGARAMDEHFETAPLQENIPILAGLIAVWHHKFMEYNSRTNIPYSVRLKLLPQFLQQLDMESNGKSTGMDGGPVTISGPVVWGAEGTNAQHAFFQHLHQSPIITPVEFTLIGDDGLGYEASSRLTIANALAQSEALMRGKSIENVMADMVAQGKNELEIMKIAPHRVFSGNRPSSTIILPKLDAYNLGIMLAFYEHRCFVEGVMYGINSFDQWGVELGKVIAMEINSNLETGDTSSRDASTASLIKYIRNL